MHINSAAHCNRCSLDSTILIIACFHRRHASGCTLLWKLLPTRITISLQKASTTAFQGVRHMPCSLILISPAQTWHPQKYRLFHEETMSVVKPGEYMGIWQIHVIWSIMGARVKSVYPRMGNVTRDLHRLILFCLQPLGIKKLPHFYQLGHIFLKTSILSTQCPLK